ncbi:MAG: bifunctional 4-hydroxy-2-oxoglutarate aldolase/2-dehydro-3-deoxy-phosphogluconate aldolase [Eubacterium sp.]|jgi:2-dehydro-3-deoxyphosphogluconate aldolase/(4S)-4-hydroxy-2-oxoglutarate aldolase|nr:bifunctional 4-hydroxy-2-oxoglutarate aldolase/2-dehydro-3-deoxy-phosphogluconate aldolase [Eubacterium sp.]NBI85183.1 keto-hydroxyglutarate-aldolase/keto-deoxy-phosphogluconate aldolase [Lachnospiraceae bacterium]
MDKVLEEFSHIGIVPVIAIEKAEDAEPLAGALINGGLPCAEVTFRTDAAEESIYRITGRFPEMLAGAGTVLTTEQAKRAVGAGAKFIVSPGFNPKVVEWCLSHDIPVIPGCACPSDMEQALSMGLSAVKFFPAEANGGLAAIKAMAAPYHTLKFMPTGGISVENLNRYLAFEKVFACGGSWMASSALIKAKDWEGIALKTREAVAAMLGLMLKRVVIHVQNEEEARLETSRFAALFGVDGAMQKESGLAGNFVEIRKKQDTDDGGQFVIGTNYVERAVYYLQKRGFCPRKYSSMHCGNGMEALGYTVGKIAGYTVRIEHV